MKFKVVLERESDGRYSVHCPALPGCVSCGDTRDEALRNIHEAMELYIETLKERGQPLPSSDAEIEIEEVEVPV